MHFYLYALLLFLTSNFAFAEDAPTQEIVNSINISWIVLAGVLVFLMQAGFGLIESGMARSKNSVNVIIKNYMDLCVGTLAYFCVGYGFMFGSNPTGFIGVDHFFMSVGSNHELAFSFFQIMFAATAVTIASGAMAERTQFKGYVIGAIIICAFIYPIFGSWAWGSFYEGSGWLAELGFIDFAGSTVVHAIGGWCALAGVIVIGPRLGRFKEGIVREIPAHNIMYVALGGFILWFGWFGFNAGSNLSADSNIGKIVYNTHLAAASGAIGIFFISLIKKGKLLATSVINGSLAGLVSVTAGCATMAPEFAILTGLIGSLVYVLGAKLLLLFEIDDVVGAIPVHAFCGVWGTLAAGIFFAENMFNFEIIFIQFVGVFFAFIWAFPLMLLVFKVIDMTVGLRAPSSDERQGLDFSEHDEQAYPEFQKDNLFNK